MHRRTDYVQANIQDGALCDILMQDRLETVFPDAKTERLDAIASEPDRTTASGRQDTRWRLIHFLVPMTQEAGDDARLVKGPNYNLEV
ncbi:MAG: hypothetical protein WCS20_17045 [Alphaproteobacteria bacterium]